MRTFLAEFLFSAVLWGSLITWGLWRWRKQAQSGIARKLLWLPVAWFGLQTAFAWYGFFLPPSGRLVDDVSGNPMPNQRVEAIWGAYPVLASIGYCPGFQAHLSDHDGDFSFRFAPAPTLLLGTFYRGINPKTPGRVMHGRAAIFPVWLRGDIRIRHYQVGRRISDLGGVGCKSKFLPQHWDGRLRGEEDPFTVVYREACIEQQPWTLTHIYIRELMRYAMLKGTQDPKGFVSRYLMPPDLNERFNNLQLGPCTSEGGACATPIDEATRKEFCAYFTTLLKIEGEGK